MSIPERIHISVHPSARRERVEEIKPGYFSIHVREEAEQGSANDRVTMLVALHFRVPVAQVSIVRGARSRSKIVHIRI